MDNDVELGSMLCNLFQASGFSVELEADGERAVARTKSEPYDLLILEVVLPGSNGFDVLRQIRHCSQVPVLILSAKTDWRDRVLAFNLGADDYVPKPFYPEELLARVLAILRRAAPSSARTPEALHVGELTLWPGTRNAYFRGRQLALTAMEYDILECLVRSSGRVVSRDDLSLYLYKRPASPFDRSVDTHVSRIRRKIGKERGLILSVRGTGYQLCCEPDLTGNP